MGRLYFEDLVAGQTEAYGGHTVTAAEIAAFARDFDPDAATADPPVASGWLVAANNMRMVYDAFIARVASMGGPGLDSLQWLAPVRAGDRLVGRRTILEMRTSKSRPEMGLVRLDIEILNQAGALVMTQRHLLMALRRGAQERPRDMPARAIAGAPPPKTAEHQTPSPPFEAFEMGATHALGAVHFDRASIIRFATAYDPQPFHVDEAAAERSHFGGLVASGWQTATGWSKAARAYQDRTQRAALPCRGPLLSLTALNWRQPVYVGDTISYATCIEARRPAAQPGWDVVETLNTGVNQAGALVFDFRGSSLWRGAG